jgi:hypothetical protein
MKENGAAYLDTGTWSAAIKKLNPLRNCCCSFFKRRKITITFQKGIQYR